MSYESEVLADNPLAYYRLDDEAFPVNGQVIIDSSGNDHDAILCFAQGDFPFNPFGQPSAIETDSQSRGLYTFSDNASHVGNHNRSYAYNSDSDLSLSGDFTVECWVKSNANVGIGSSLPFFGKRGRFRLTRAFTGSGSGADWRFSIRVTLSDSNTYTVTAPGQVENNVFYHVVGVRLENALSIFVNGQLTNLLTVPGLPQDTASSSPLTLTPCQPPGDILVMGGLPFNDIHNDCILDECAIYDYALNEARILAHYEAALNVLNMRGECNIRTTATLSGADEPDPADYSFRHNWSEPVIERFRWRTGVFKPTDGPVTLRRQRSSLRRQVEYSHLLYNEKLRRQFEARAFAGQTTLVQFEPDKVQVGSLLAGATTAVFPTTYLDFEVGQRVLIYQDDDNYEFHTLTDVSSNGIEWDTGLGQNYLRAWVKPARVAHLPTTQEIQLHTDIIGEGSTIYDYLPEDEPLNPRRITPFTPTLTYHAREVFDLSEWQGHDYSELPTIEYVADRSELDDGAGVVSAKQYRWGADTVQPYNMNLDGRELIAKYLGWLYYRAGMYEPFWMPTFVQNLKPLSRSGDDLTVEGHEYSNYYASADSRADLAFVYLDGSMELRRITASTTSGANDVLTLDDDAPTLTGLRWLSFLRRVTLSSDDIEIAWQTDRVVRVGFAVVDAPLDFALGSPSVSPSPSASISTSTSPSSSASLSVSPSSSQSPSSSPSPTPSSSVSLSPSPSPSASPSV